MDYQDRNDEIAKANGNHITTNPDFRGEWDDEDLSEEELIAKKEELERKLLYALSGGPFYKRN